MELIQIDNQIKKCNDCGNMVEKFDNETTVFKGKKSDIIIVGEAPANNGWRKSKIPFYDINHRLLPSGIVLQKLLKLIDHDLEDISFVEAIKCYPRARKYLKECSENCKKYLVEQLLTINPKLILTLGDTATKTLLDVKYSKYGDIVGKCFDYNGFDVIPIYHPSPISPVGYNGNIDIFKKTIREKLMEKNISEEERNELLRYFILSGYRDGEYFLPEEYEELESIIKRNRIARYLEEVRFRFLTQNINEEEYNNICNDYYKLVLRNKS